MRKLLCLAGLLLLAVPAYAQYPPDESAYVIAMAASTGDLIKNDSHAFTDTVCAGLALKDRNWGRKVRRAGDWASRNSDAIAYRFGSDENKALVDIVFNSTDLGGPPSPNAGPAWQVYPAPNTGNGYWMSCYVAPPAPPPPPPPPPRANQFGKDFDGDGKPDIGLFRPSTATWYIVQSTTRSSVVTSWGESTDVHVPADYDGDGRADVAVYRPSEGRWHVLASSTGVGTSTQWGAGGDVPVPGDYDGDGKADLCVWRPSNGTWYWLKSIDNYSWATAGIVQWGAPGDVPAPGDYDGDGKTDPCVWRPTDGRWYWLKSGANYTWASYGSVQWGAQVHGDQLAPTDFDGDGKADPAVWRPATGTWYWLKSTDNYSWATFGSRQWGSPGDVAAPADYDNDGKADLVVFRASNGYWYAILSSTGEVISYRWGIVGDKPI